MGKKRVLMIDNDGYSLAVLHRLLSEMGYEPLVGSTPAAAEALIEARKADAIVYNQDLEAEWGYSLLDRLRRCGETAHIPVILLTQSATRYGPRVEDVNGTTVRFRKPIAIEPFVALFRKVVEGQAAPSPH